MSDLTRHERLVLSFIALVLLAGLSLHMAFKKNPSLLNIVNVMDQDAIYRPVDINRADYDALVRIPYIGEKTARRILSYRKNNGDFSSIEELKEIQGISNYQYDRIKKYLTVLTK